MRTTSIVALALAAGCSPCVLGQADFAAQWHDGRAELDGYRWTVTRYGQARDGQVVMIFVTEPFSDARRVKVDDPSKDPADTLDVLKLNLIRDFQTGIYDYNTMTSVFVRTEDFAPVKVSFTSAEWCGHVYEELIVDPGRIEGRFFSYFENESSTTTLDGKPGGVLEDNLFILLRGLKGSYLEPGEERQVPFLASAFARRLKHAPLAWGTATVQRLAEPQQVEVPAGRFTTDVYVVRTDDGREGRFWVEADSPHRIVRWQWTGTGPDRRSSEATGTGELTGTTRVEYWRLHGNGDERYLDDLGLTAVD